MLKKKIYLAMSIILIALLILSFSLIGHSADIVKEVKIGFLWPLTGGSASIGSQENDGAQLAIEEINNSGGIKALGGAKILPILADTQTSPDVGVGQAERLILEEKIDLLIGCYNSSVTFPVSEVAQRYKTPMLCMGSVKNEITERGFDYVFRINNKTTYDVKEMILALTTFEEEKGETIKTVGLMYEGTDWGTDTANTLKIFIEEQGWQIVVDESSTPGQADMNPQVIKIKRANPDVLFLALYTPDQILFTKTFTANRVNIRLGLMSAGAGTEDIAFYNATTPEDVEYLFVQDDWNTGGPDQEEWIAEVAKKCEEKYGYKMMTYFSQGYSTVYVAKEILEMAGSVDKSTIRETASKIDITDGPALLTGYQRIKFDENGQNTYAHGTVSQRQNNKRVVLWPEGNRTEGAEVIWPIPDWKDR